VIVNAAEAREDGKDMLVGPTMRKEPAGGLRRDGEADRVDGDEEEGEPRHCAPIVHRLVQKEAWEGH
jgi:hypothetical protein